MKVENIPYNVFDNPEVNIVMNVGPCLPGILNV